MRRTLALVFALAAVLLFAPIARADIDGGIAPYRDLVDQTTDGSDIMPADDDDDEEDDEDEASDDDEDDDEDDESDDEDEDQSSDDDEDESDDDEEDDEDDGSDDDDDTGSSPPPTTDTPPEEPQGPSPSGVSAAPAYWIWLLLIALAGGVAGTAYILRRRMRAR